MHTLFPYTTLFRSPAASAPASPADPVASTGSGASNAPGTPADRATPPETPAEAPTPAASTPVTSTTVGPPTGADASAAPTPPVERASEPVPPVEPAAPEATAAEPTAAESAAPEATAPEPSAPAATEPEAAPTPVEPPTAAEAAPIVVTSAAEPPEASAEASAAPSEPASSDPASSEPAPSTPDATPAAPSTPAAPPVERTPEPVPPVEPAAPATVSLQQFKDVWPEILEAVQKENMNAWTVVFTAVVRDLRGDVLTLGFTNQTDHAKFKELTPSGDGISAILRSAILDLLGFRVKFIAQLSNAPAAPAPAPQRTTQAPPPADDEAPEQTEPDVEPGGWAVASIPPSAPTEAELRAQSAAARKPVVKEEPAPTTESVRYGEAVVREILNATFIEEQPVAPRVVPKDN